MKKNKNLIILIVGKILSELGSSIFSFALSLYILDLTGSAKIFSTILALTLIPTFLVNLLCGGIVDRKNNKYIMVITDLFNGLILFIYFIVFRSVEKNIFIIGVLIILINALKALFSLALNASFPEMVGEENVVQANAYIQGIAPAVQIVGPVIGAVCYEHIGIRALVIVNSLIFIISSVLECFFVFDNNVVEKEIESTYGDILIFFKNNRFFVEILVFAILTNGIFLPQISLGVPFVSYNIIDVTPTQLSFVEMSGAIGSILGVIFVGVYKRNKNLLNYFFILLEVQAVCIMLFSTAQICKGKMRATLVFSLLVFLIQVLNMIQNIPLFIYLQTNIPKKIRGRVIGIAFAALYVTPSIGMLTYGFLFETVSSSIVFGMTGILLILMCYIASRKIDFGKI